MDKDGISEIGNLLGAIGGVPGGYAQGQDLAQKRARDAQEAILNEETIKTKRAENSPIASLTDIGQKYENTPEGKQAMSSIFGKLYQTPETLGQAQELEPWRMAAAGPFGPVQAGGLDTETARPRVT